MGTCACVCVYNRDKSPYLINPFLSRIHVLTHKFALTAHGCVTALAPPNLSYKHSPPSPNLKTVVCMTREGDGKWEIGVERGGQENVSLGLLETALSDETL